jgi:pimeloyl-ACP methyl ester carboxylesterase
MSVTLESEKTLTTVADENSGEVLPPLVIKKQGSFAVGGTVLTTSARGGTLELDRSVQTLHGDHAYVFYQIPVRARKYPLALLHGQGQFSKTWETTPDGREGYQNIFLRRGFGVYLIDQPRRGGAGRSTEPATLAPELDDQNWFNIFRVGIWPEYFPGVQFSRDADTLDQYFRQITPDTGPFDIEVKSDAVSALFDKIGPAILVTHSRGGGVGWLAAIKSSNAKAIISYEPGTNFPFPEGEVPPAMDSSWRPLEPATVSLDQFMSLTRIPILIVYGDFIPKQAVDNPGQDLWRVRVAMAKLWAGAVNRRGGDVTVVCLPDVGIRGNTHFPFSDLNNIEIADHMSDFLKAKGLD